MDLSYDVEDTNTPFGRAFYGGKAAYTVIPIWGVVVDNMFWQGVCTCYNNCPTVVSLLIVSIIMDFGDFEYSPGQLFRMTFLTFVPLQFSLCFIALFISISSKWLLLGTREFSFVFIFYTCIRILICLYFLLCLSISISERLLLGHYLVLFFNLYMNMYIYRSEEIRRGYPMYT